MTTKTEGIPAMARVKIAPAKPDTLNEELARLRKFDVTPASAAPNTVIICRRPCCRVSPSRPVWSAGCQPLSSKRR